MWHIRRAGVCPYSRNKTAWTLEGTLEVSQATSHRWRKKESEITDETLILHPIPMSGIFFSPHAKQFSDTIWMLYNSTQSWHYRPGESIRFHSWRTQSYKIAASCPTSVASHKAGLSAVFWSASYILKVPMAPFLGSIEALEQVTELRKMFTYRSLVYYKRI